MKPLLGSGSMLASEILVINSLRTSTSLDQEILLGSGHMVETTQPILNSKARGSSKDQELMAPRNSNLTQTSQEQDSSKATGHSLLNMSLNLNS